MASTATKTFDSVETMRQARRELGERIAGMSGVQLKQWLRSREYSDPRLRRLAERAAQQAAAADAAAPRR
jgi:hypothetical protein